MRRMGVKGSEATNAVSPEEQLPQTELEKQTCGHRGMCAKKGVCTCLCARCHSDVSDSLRPQGPQPTRLLCPWDFPGKDAGVGCRFLLQGLFPAQGSSSRFLRLLHRQADSLSLCRLGNAISSLELENLHVCKSLEKWKRWNHAGQVRRNSRVMSPWNRRLSFAAIAEGLAVGISLLQQLIHLKHQKKYTGVSGWFT